jgi:hypothetical protein
MLSPPFVLSVAQRPVKFGLRFCAKAHTASWWSLERFECVFKAQAQIHHRMGKLTQRDVDGLLGPADRPHRAASQSSG